MAKSSKFPLFRHRQGYWAKTIRYKTHYFGRIEGDPTGKHALRRYISQRDYLQAGLEPPTGEDDPVQVRDCCNAWLTHKKELLENGELAPRTFNEYRDTVDLVVASINRHMDAKLLCPEHFQKLRKDLADRYGVNGLGKRIGQVRSIFKFSYESGKLSAPVRFGPTFKKPKAKVYRTHRAQKGKQMFEAAEILALLEHAHERSKAMILLGVNCGFGNNECAELPEAAIDGDWLDWYRPKNGVYRRCYLWEETRQALQAALAARPNTSDGLVFVKPNGDTYRTPKSNGYKVTHEFNRCRKLAGDAVRNERTFYDLRRTFETKAGEAKDQPAVDLVMGHIAPETDMAARYRQDISDSRLQDVAAVVHAWLYGGQR